MQIRDKLKELEPKDLKSPAFGDKDYPIRHTYMTHKRGHSSPLVTCGSEKCHYTLKQLKELITDIYIQKVKHDDKSVNMNN